MLIILTYLLFTFIDLSTPIYYSEFNSGYNIFIFVATILLPTMSSNILATYITLKSDYKPAIIYLLVIELYRYLVPIVPNPNEYVYSLIFLILPISILLRIDKLYKNVTDSFKKNYERKDNSLALVITFLLIITTSYFTSGYFKYYAISIASGSMKPNINKGDVVIVQKIKKTSQLEKNQIIAFEYNDIIVVHRLIDIKRDKQKYYFYTKGDANLEQDKFVVNESMIIGVVKTKIPYLGFPTIWLSEL